MLNIQRYLADGGTFDDLLTRYGIKARRHRTLPQLVLLKYDQIASPMGERLVQECRGIVLDQDNDWGVVARAFDKFFNHGEGHAAPIDWATARVQEKVDGSLCLLFPYEGEWHVATTGTPDASGDINQGGAGSTFADYFWSTFPGGREYLPRRGGEAGRYCFFFELTGPLNRVVVPHARAGLTLLGARDLTTGFEVRPQVVAHFLPEGIPVVREFPLGSFTEVAATFATMSTLKQEGYVVVDGAFNRVKVKHPGYVVLHHAKDGMTTKAFVEIARSGETSEVIAAFPEFKPLLDEVKGRFEQVVAAVEAEYAQHKHIGVQKDFALAVKDSRCSAALFSVRSGRSASVRAFFAGTSLESVMRLLGYKDEALR